MKTTIKRVLSAAIAAQLLCPFRFQMLSLLTLRSAIAAGFSFMVPICPIRAQESPSYAAADSFPLLSRW